jgi:hypothetical protein
MYVETASAAPVGPTDLNQPRWRSSLYKHCGPPDRVSEQICMPRPRRNWGSGTTGRNRRGGKGRDPDATSRMAEWKWRRAAWRVAR